MSQNSKDTNRTPTKRKATTAGFVQHLSPRKISKKGNAYYTFQLQTDAGSCIKGACFSPRKEKELRKFSENKSAMSLAGFVKDEKSGEILINDTTQMSPASYSEVPFAYQEMQSLVPAQKPCAQFEVAELEDKIGTTEMISVTGEICFTL